MKNIVVENTLYSLFIYLLLKKDWENDIFILFGDFNYLNIKGDNFYIDKIFSIKKNFIKFYYNKIKFLIFLIKKNIFFNNKVNFYGNYDYMDFMILNRNIYILEDGTINYVNINNKKTKIIQSILRFKNPFFFSSNYKHCIKKRYLTGLASIPSEIEANVEIIDLKNLWRKKSTFEREKILELFNFSIEKIKIYKEKKYILFTQPLSEDDVISEEEKIRLYMKILKDYDNSKVVIKIHPREKTKYSKFFKKALIIEDRFPAELLNMFGIKFEKAITIFSTAALTVDKNIKVDWYGTEVHPKILERFGSMEKIMKTNAYIKE